MNNFIEDKRDDFLKVIDFFKKEIVNVRVGRANPAILDSVFVEAYGVKGPINTVANISVSDARSIVLTPWDKNVSKDIEKALVEANLGVGITNEGDKIRISIPQMTEESRLESVKKLNEKQEKSRIIARQLRDEIKSTIEEAFDNKEIGEDDKFRFLKELDEEIAKINDELKAIRDKKEKDIMEI